MTETPSTPSVATLKSLTLPRQLLIGAALVLLINSFLPWYHSSFGEGDFKVSVSASGWHQLGTLVWILVIVLIAVEAARLFGVLPLDAKKSELASLAVAALVLLFGLIYVIIRLADGDLGFAFFIGIVGLAVLGYATFALFQSGDTMNTIKSMQGSSSSGSTTAAVPPVPPAAPPAPPAAPPTTPPSTPPAAGPPTTPPTV